MSAVAVAVEGCTIEITSEQETVVPVEIKTSPSSYSLVNGKAIYFGDIDVLLTTITAGAFVCESGTITITATARNVLEGTKKAVQQGDNGTKTLKFKNPNTGATSDLPVTIEVTNAGQSDVIAS